MQCRIVSDDGPEDWGSAGVNSSDARTRFDFDANVSARDLADSYLRGFEAGARPDLGAASGLMCSYNSGQCGCAAGGFCRLSDPLPVAAGRSERGAGVRAQGHADNKAPR